MGSHKRRSRPQGTVQLVRATSDFSGRTTPPAPVSVKDDRPFGHKIVAGMEGLLHGQAQGAPDLYDVEFEGEGGSYLRVEVYPDQIEFVK